MLAALAALALAVPAAAPERPPIAWTPIPYPARRRAEMAAYARRHYGLSRFRLVRPRVIVQHMTEGATFRSAFNTFAPDVPDGELGELPGVCAHFVIDRDGTIHQLVPLGLMCRHTVGLNWTAIGVEHVGFRESDVLSGPQRTASLRLSAWLRCREGIALKQRHRPQREPALAPPPRARRAAAHADARRLARGRDAHLPRRAGPHQLLALIRASSVRAVLAKRTCS